MTTWKTGAYEQFILDTWMCLLVGQVITNLSQERR